MEISSVYQKWHGCEIHMRTIKAIALDLDGTLVSSNHHVSEENKKVIRMAAEQGITIILSSGRPYASVRKIADEIHLAELSGFIVAFNGAYVEKSGENEAIFEKRITTNQAKRLADFIENGKEIEFLTYDEKQMIVAGDYHPFASKIAEGLLLPVEEVSDAKSLTQQEVCKYIIAGETSVLQSLSIELERTFVGELSIIYGGGNFIEIMPRHISKATGMATVLERLQIKPEQLMCCGDSKNDLKLMQYAGYPVAMGNASEDIKAIAKHVTDICDADGVAKAISKLLFDC